MTDNGLKNETNGPTAPQAMPRSSTSCGEAHGPAQDATRGLASDEVNRDAEPPQAILLDHHRVVHGDDVNDPYEWMRDKESPDLKAFVAAENAYCARRTTDLAGLRTTLFEELKARVQETDMSVPTRIDGFWYFTRTREGSQYAVQCRLPIRGEDDWDPPVVDEQGEPGSMPGEQIVFDANREAQGHDFFRIGGLDLSRDGRWLLYGIDTSGNERYDFAIRDLSTGGELPDRLVGVSGACFTPDGQWVFYVRLDDAWRPYAVSRHHVGHPSDEDVEVFQENDERFWVGVGLSFDERHIVISTSSKTSSEVLLLAVDTPEGAFQPFIRRQRDVEYDVSFSRFEGAGEHGEDIPIATVYHNANNPNFEVDVIDMRTHRPPFRLGEGVVVAQGSPYGCEHGDDVLAGAGSWPVSTPYSNPDNPEILRGASGLGIEGLAVYRHFVVLMYRSEGLPHIAVAPAREAARDFTARRPWRLRVVTPPRSSVAGEHGEHGDGRIYAIGAGGNPSYEAPHMRYSFTSYTRPGELHELDVAHGTDRLLKRARVLGGYDMDDYAERRVWATVRDGERVPVSLVWRKDALPWVPTMPGEISVHAAASAETAASVTTAAPADGGRTPSHDAPMFITGYGAYEISSDPGFSAARISMLDRGVLYAVAHIRGGGEMGRAWYEQGRRLTKKHSFEDFVDVTMALQDAGYANPRRTVANGGSAGGLLMGAVANMAPERYAGIEADVPFVDALTSILDPSLPLTVTEWDEWGDPLHDAQVYRYMKSYSPYENAPSARHPAAYFPKIFVTTSMNDTRVLYVEPLKWIARLQAAGVDAIGKIEIEAGHGGTSGRYRQWEEVSYENAWCLSTMDAREPRRSAGDR